MNENIDLTKILDGCPAGTEFYHLIFGQVALREVIKDEYPIVLEPVSNSRRTALTKEGRLYAKYDGECLLYPSKYQRDWSKFVRFWDKPKKERFDSKTLQPFDKVLVRNSLLGVWGVDIFGYLNGKCSYCFCSVRWNQCVPYNEETKHLVGTVKDCPEYYKWWEK